MVTGGKTVFGCAANFSRGRKWDAAKISDSGPS